MNELINPKKNLTNELKRGIKKESLYYRDFLKVGFRVS